MILTRNCSGHKSQTAFSILPMLKSFFIKRKGNGTSPIRAVIFALAGTLGVGNIVGVASAIALGGAGAVFWMWVSAFFAMILKYGEVVLAVLHRRSRNSENYGGAMYYMMDYFSSHKKNFMGLIYSFIFTTFLSSMVKVVLSSTFKVTVLPS